MNVVLLVGSMKLALSRCPPSLAFLVAASLLTTACTMQPGTQAVSVSNVTDSNVAQTEKLVCHSEKQTGTSFSIKVCKTAAQWNAIDKKQREDAYDYTRQAFENGAVTNAKNLGQCMTCNMKE